MQFTYKIENYYPLDSRAFVIYTAADASKPPLGVWVYITDDMTEEQIDTAIIAAAPVSKWMKGENAAIAAKLGKVSGLKTPPVVEPFVPPTEPDVPQVVSIYQAKEALAAAGYLIAVNAYFASEAATPAEKRAWENITEVRRNSPLMAKLATMLGLSDAQVDALFVAASQISA